MSVQSRRFCFTLNNYTDAEVAQLRTQCAHNRIVYAVFGKEIAPTTGTPHLQGFLIFARQQRRTAVLRLFGQRLHLEATRGTSQQARDYCKKDGNFEEFGTFPESHGRRTDLEEAVAWADEFHADNKRCITLRDVALAHPTIAIKYPRFVEVLQSRFEPEPIMELDGVELRQWQVQLEETLSSPADDRSVNFVYDMIGGKGKTWFAHYMMSKHPDKVQILSVAKRDDLAYMLDETKSIFFFNVPRGGMEFFQYTIVEMIKDKLVISPKYQSRVKRMMPSHVVVLCNEPPDYTKLSADRIKVVNLNGGANII